MYKMTQTYTDYDGNQRTEDFYFHLTKAEITEMDFLEDGGLQKTIEKIIATQDRKALIDIFKKLVIGAYGEKSADGRRFMKTDEIRRNFTETEAYSEIFMKLATDDNEASKFINNIIPKDLQEEAKKMENVVSIDDKIAASNN